MQRRRRSNHAPLLRPSFNARGFTLVEVMVTVTLIGLVTASLAGMYYAMQVASVRTQHLDMAMRAARTEIENLRNTGYSSLTPGSTITFTANLPAALPKDKQGTVSVSEPVDDLRRVDVTITYTDYGKPQRVTLSSDIGIIGLGQGQ